MTEPANRIVMRLPPGFSFWRAVILAGGLFFVVIPTLLAIAMLVGGVLIIQGSGDGTDLSTPPMMAGYLLFVAVIWFCIIDRRLPRMKKTALSSQPQDSGGESTK
jgi:hypothetical protein